MRNTTNWKTKLINFFNKRSNLQIILVVLLALLSVITVLLVAAAEDYQALRQQSLGNYSADDLVTYKDRGLGVEIAYPQDWQVHTIISTDSSYEDPDIPVGNIPDISQFEVIINKESTEVNFVHFFGELDARVSIFPTDKRIYEIVSDNLLRYQSSDREKWYYVDVVECDNYRNQLEIVSTDICVGDYFSGFVSGPSRVVISGRLDSARLAVADEIVSSAMR